MSMIPGFANLMQGKGREQVRLLPTVLALVSQALTCCVLVACAHAQEATDRIKRFMTIMDSMHQTGTRCAVVLSRPIGCCALTVMLSCVAELDGDDKIFNTQPNRIVRIARGAGVSMRAVHEVSWSAVPDLTNHVALRLSGD